MQFYIIGDIRLLLSLYDYMNEPINDKVSLKRPFYR